MNYVMNDDIIMLINLAAHIIFQACPYCKPSN